MANILIIYGTAHGQTALIAQEIARVLRTHHEVTVLRGNQLQDRSPAGYDAFVVAGSVRFGRHQRYIQTVVRAHVGLLNSVPSAFVSVSGAMAGSEPESQRIARGYRDAFLEATGWRPGIARSVAGGIPFTRYRPWTRWMMKMISRRTGRPTDTSRDYDFTDWREVRKLAEDFAALLAPGAPAAGAKIAAYKETR
jgi:menaquinone-dependent protoporphyrinogen oxidase